MLDRLKQSLQEYKPLDKLAFDKMALDRIISAKSFGHHHTDEVNETSFREDSLRLLSFNIQAGQSTNRYRDYLTKSWKQFIPTANLPHLNQLSNIIGQYDMVALQEVDGGSIRSGFINQVSYIAERENFEYWYQQLNRDFGQIGQFSNGFLSRRKPYTVESHKLPGWRGRGAIVAKFGNPDNPLVLVGLHLALGEKNRYLQLEYVREIIDQYSHVIIMGDLNCQSDQLIDTPLRDLGLKQASNPLNTFPSWQPSKNLDHILVTPNLKINRVEALPITLSDHLPIAMEIGIPADLKTLH